MRRRLQPRKDRGHEKGSDRSLLVLTAITVLALIGVFFAAVAEGHFFAG